MSRDKNRLDFLIKAIDDTQSTIRFTDTKAAAVIVYWSFFITTLIRTQDQWYGWLIKYTSITLEGFLIYSLLTSIAVFFLQSIWLVYLAISPRSNPAEHIQKQHVHTPGLYFLFETTPSVFSKVKYLYFNNLEPKMSKSIKTYLSELKNLSDDGLYEELILELQKTSYIRTLKIYRVNVAISKIIYTLICLFILIIYGFIISKISPHVKGGILVNHFEINAALFLTLYIGHKIGDYLLQTDNQATKKHGDWMALLQHCLVYTLVLTLLPYFILGYFSITAILIIFITHVVIDKGEFLKWWAQSVKGIKKPDDPNVKQAIFELDQAFHYIVIFVISILA
ncbi:DUF3307 domain-containing protein [Rossellomorea sp. NRS-1567]|uniref:DUF3307 domain-containing protein n=1 Tax=Rossellomorea sp. NRS-1567 TaxID=3233901 RepID=UPI003D2B2C85